MRRLFPEPSDDISVDDAYAGPLGHDERRPWVGLCMVASIDGSIAVAGTSGGLSSPTDIAVLGRLRQLADVIIVGSGTVSDEGYGPPGKQGQRIGVVTRHGNVDPTSPLFRSGSAFLLTTDDADFDASGIDVVRAGHGSVDFALAIERIAALEPACSFIQAEGGARLNGALLDADVIDEINVTMSPSAVGGDGPRLAAGADSHSHRYELGQLAVDEESFLYARWLRRRD